MSSIGFTVPFRKASGSLGLFETTRDKLSALKEDVKSLVLTNWGERPANYSLGCNLREFLFEQMTDELRIRIGDRIVDQFSRWLPFLSIDELGILFPTDSAAVPENSIKITISFSLRNSIDHRGRVDVMVQA